MCVNSLEAQSKSAHLPPPDSIKNNANWKEFWVGMRLVSHNHSGTQFLSRDSEGSLIFNLHAVPFIPPRLLTSLRSIKKMKWVMTFLSSP